MARSATRSVRVSATVDHYVDNRFGTASITVAQGTTDRAISVLGNMATIQLPKNAMNLTIPVLNR